MRWRHAAPVPATPVLLTGLRVAEVTLRFPPDAPSGGEVTVVRLTASGDLNRETFAFRAGQPDALATTPFLAWLEGILRQQGLLPAETAIDIGPTVRPVTVPPAPERPLGRLS